MTGVGYQPPELAWAPGGRAVAYGNGPRLCVYTLASRVRECRRISDNDVETVSHPSFAPGGDVLVFSLTDNTDVTHLMVVGAQRGTGPAADPAPGLRARPVVVPARRPHRVHARRWAPSSTGAGARR